jgi:hypothetical protein
MQLLIEPASPVKLRQTMPRRRLSPTTWLNLICLDAPIVAVTWQCFFSRSCHILLPIYPRSALFLSAWLIYLADRLADSWSLRRNDPLSLRQQFCRSHQRTWFVMIVTLAVVDLWIISQRLDGATIERGILLGAIAVAYLAVNYWLGKIWRVIPVKEICVGSLFAAGTIAALLPKVRYTIAIACSFVFFAALCSFNCISIAIWERELDRAQRKNSIATGWPEIQMWFRPFVFVSAIVVIAIGFATKTFAQLYFCIGASALLLVILDWLGEKIPRDERTALADLVLLTPLLVLAFASV